MSENGEIYTTGKNSTLPPALTGWTNSPSAQFINIVLHWDFPSHFNHHVIINVNSELIFSLSTILIENNGEEIQCNTKEVS